MNLTILTKKIIAENTYMSIATSDADNPWISPVHYAVDKDYIFYFASMPISLHSRNIIKNSNVAIAIFDSTLPEGDGLGVQIKGKAELLPEGDYPHALEFYHSKFVPSEIEALKKSPYDLYKITPSEIYINDPESDKDERALIKL